MWRLGRSLGPIGAPQKSGTVSRGQVATDSGAFEGAACNRPHFFTAPYGPGTEKSIPHLPQRSRNQSALRVGCGLGTVQFRNRVTTARQTEAMNRALQRRSKRDFHQVFRFGVDVADTDLRSEVLGGRREGLSGPGIPGLRVRSACHRRRSHGHWLPEVLCRAAALSTSR